MTRYVIIDRDGVVNEDSDDYIKSVAEWIPIPGALEAMARLSATGFLVTVATNQSGLARGLFDIDALSTIHQALRQRVSALGGRIELVAFCPHGPDDGCDCRKPKTGLFREISRRLGAGLTNVPVIGDSMRDIVAGHAVGARPILVRTGNGRVTEAAMGASELKVEVVDDLAAAAELILGG